MKYDAVLPTILRKLSNRIFKKTVWRAVMSVCFSIEVSRIFAINWKLSTMKLSGIPLKQIAIKMVISS